MDIDNIKNELRTLGFTEDKLNQLMDLAAEEALAITIEELQTTASDEVLEDLAKTFENEPANEADATAKLNMVFDKAYGPNANAKKEELILTYLRETLEDTKKAKDLYTRYQAGDPSAVATVKAQEGNPDVQKITDMM